MTRKSYVKLLMSHGISRNEAQTITLLIRSSGKSYSSAYHEGILPDPLEETVKRLMEITIPFGKALTEFCGTLCDEAKTAFVPITRQFLEQSDQFLKGDDISARSYAGGSPEVDAADLPGDEVHGAPAEPTEHSGTVSG